MKTSTNSARGHVKYNYLSSRVLFANNGPYTTDIYINITRHALGPWATKLMF